eukprot:NODE_1905_length_1339_cov_33.605611_g1810_i0.p1 GENE.NODE_1905_length_1339_cov_33.605611_g1810_i0~~NODE_1905_length_1339_cov_33.605611_g1810_i0.p1  ORF type:complete len:411 (-),score=103.41 NODE_1905_length_1339_cov_33.605611_g1810_i0:107-1222(-)
MHGDLSFNAEEHLAEEEENGELYRSNAFVLDEEVPGPGRRRAATITNRLREVVSKKKLRFKQDGFDLDLSYITRNIIAMGFPSIGKESIYRNPLPQVEDFLKCYHDHHYRVYNLCCERSYPPLTFDGNWEQFGFMDHNPPPLSMFLPFCTNVKQYLDSDDRNTAALHCKAGKGRTGTMISAYLLYTGAFSKAADAMDFFGRQRTTDGQGVTIPSQRRYVQYWQEMLSQAQPSPRPVPIHLQQITLITTPHFDRDGGCDPFFIISQTKSKCANMRILYDFRSTGCVRHYLQAPHIILRLTPPLELQGDLKFEFYDQSSGKKDQPMFHFWVNTQFLQQNPETTLPKCELDRAFKDKRSEDFDSGFACILHHTK